MRKTDLKYALTFGTCVLSILVPVFLINFIYDPGEIYFQKMIKGKYVNDYVKMLLSSPSGVREFANERAVKAQLARYAGPYNTVIYGSSRIMQLSPLHMSNFNGSFPAPALNLAASAWTLEDTLIFTRLLLQNPKMPQAMVISMDPWALRWNVSERYSILKEDLTAMFNDLGVKRTTQKPELYLIKLLVNSISFEYFVQSLKRLFDPSFKIIPDNHLKNYEEVKNPNIADGYDFDQGYDIQITLKDGSRVFSKKTIGDLKNDYAQGNVGFVGQEGEYWDDNAIDIFEKMITYVRKKGTEVYFVLIPFSPLVFEQGHAADRDRLLAVEQKIRELAAKNNITVLGTYDPQKSHLEANDFFDCQHPKPSTLGKFDFRH